MKLRKVWIKLSIFAGLLIAPTAWAINTQLGEILPYIDCRQQGRFSALGSFFALAAASLAGAISWGWVRHARATSSLTSVSSFTASLGALSALIFAFALSLQGIAALVLSGCER
jgi:hypothetical protein